MKNLFLGIDIGTSACKLTLFDESGGVVCGAMRGYALHYAEGAVAEQNAEDWWAAVCLGLNELWEKGADAKSVAAIGVSGQSWSAVPVGSGGEALANSPIWLDGRAAAVCRRWEKRLGAERIFAVSKNPFSPCYTLPKVLHWMECEPELIDSAEHIFQSNSFIVYRLTGVASMDYSQGYGWQNFDQSGLEFDEALTAEFNLPRRFLTSPVPSDTIVGRVSAEASAATGLLRGTPVVAGGLDAACATLGAGVVDPGQTQEQGGQAGGMSVCADKPLAHAELILSAHVIPGRWLLQGGTVAGGASLKWFSENLGARPRSGGERLKLRGGDVFKLLSAEAESSRPGANGIVCLPYFAGERSPIWDERARGVYFGIKFSSTHADMVRATMEGAAFALRHNIETAESAGARIDELRAVGGAAKSRIWTQIKADVTGIPMVITDSGEGASRGAAMLAMVAMGCYGDYEDAARAIVRLKRRQEPCAGKKAVYDRFYEIYRGLYPRTRDYMARLGGLEELE